MEELLKHHTQPVGVNSLLDYGHYSYRISIPIIPVDQQTTRYCMVNVSTLFYCVFRVNENNDPYTDLPRDNYKSYHAERTSLLSLSVHVTCKETIMILTMCAFLLLSKVCLHATVPLACALHGGIVCCKHGTQTIIS